MDPPNAKVSHSPVVSSATRLSHRDHAASRAPTPSLPHELIEDILITAAHLIFHQRHFKMKETVNQPIKNFLESTQKPQHPPLLWGGALSRYVKIAHDLWSVKRFVLPLLSHAWPPPVAAAKGRLDALEKARQLHLLASWLSHTGAESDAPNVERRLALIVEKASNNGHANVLRWIRHHWPQKFVECTQHVHTIEQAIMIPATCLRGDRGADNLEFWVVESGVNAHGSMLERVGARSVLNYAMGMGRASVVRWWVDHLDVLGEEGGRWDWECVCGVISAGVFDVLDVCAEAEELGKVQFVARQRLPGEVTLEKEETVRIADRVVDLASRAGKVELLEQWVQRQRARGLAIIYTEAALDKCKSVPALNWWASSGLQLEYSHLALHRATALREIDVLDWWLAAHRQGITPDLKYNRQLIMALASMDCRFDHSIHKHTPISWRYDWKGPGASRKKTLSVLTWWADSGLDLESPVDNMDPAGLSCPSPIDVCMDVDALNWWLDRAKRLHATSPKISSLQDHFPRYSQIAMHRAAYFNLTDVLDWWADTAKPAGLQLRFQSHRIVELSAMTPWLQQVDFRIEYSSLAWCLRLLRSVRFRGRLVEWVAAAHKENDISDEERERAVMAVKQFCGSSKRAVDVESGGMPPPAESGYGCKEPGEKFVFAPVRELGFVQGFLH